MFRAPVWRRPKGSWRRALGYFLAEAALELGPCLDVVGLAFAAGPGGGVDPLHARLETGIGVAEADEVPSLGLSHGKNVDSDDET